MSPVEDFIVEADEKQFPVFECYHEARIRSLNKHVSLASGIILFSSKMTKVRKVKKSKRYQYNVNRKRMNKKRAPTIENMTVKKAWNTKASSQKNFKKLGLVFDVNKDIKSMNKEGGSLETVKIVKATKSVVSQLEKDAAAAATGKSFRFSQDEVDHLTYFLDKYGDDYKAMSRDRKNYLQHTWKQIRHKINLFKRIPDHYNEYLRNKENKSDS